MRANLVSKLYFKDKTNFPSGDLACVSSEENLLAITLWYHVLWNSGERLNGKQTPDSSSQRLTVSAVWYGKNTVHRLVRVFFPYHTRPYK